MSNVENIFVVDMPIKKSVQLHFFGKIEFLVLFIANMKPRESWIFWRDSPQIWQAGLFVPTNIAVWEAKIWWQLLSFFPEFHIGDRSNLFCGGLTEVVNYKQNTVGNSPKTRTCIDRQIGTQLPFSGFFSVFDEIASDN